jgi:hypothetical protein
MAPNQSKETIESGAELVELSEDGESLVGRAGGDGRFIFLGGFLTFKICNQFNKGH